MKTKLEVNLDLDSMISKFISDTWWYNDIESYIKYTMWNEIKNSINLKVNEKLKDDIDWYSLDVYQMTKSKYHSEINQKLKETIDKAFNESLQSYIDGRLKNRVDFIIDKHIEDYINKNLIENLNKMINSIITVSSIDLERERQNLEDFARDQANWAYEAGQCAAAKEIWRMF